MEMVDDNPLVGFPRVNGTQTVQDLGVKTFHLGDMAGSSSPTGDKIEPNRPVLSPESVAWGKSMSTGRKLDTAVKVLLLCLSVFCIGMAGQTRVTPQTQTSHNHRKTTKKLKAHLPPLPSGPTGPVQQVPLDSMAPVPPQVSYQNSQLTINAPNSTLGDILRAVRKQTGAEIEIPSASERVVTHLGPGPAREVMAELLNGSR